MTVKFANFFSILLIPSTVTSYPYPKLKIYPGEIWPKPKFAKFDKDFILINRNNLNYEADNCQSITNAFLRFSEKLSDGASADNLEKQTFKYYKPVNLKVEYNICEQIPHNSMDESYKLVVSENVISLQATSNWGILHAFTSLEQLLWDHENINKTEIYDAPFLKYRGILLDTARHYLPLSVIKRQLELMHLNKFNVFHWHIVDDQSFPMVSKVYPKLCNPWIPSAIYTIEEITDLVEFSSNLGIRVIPEFDTPGHTESWGNVSKNFSAHCSESSLKTQDNVEARGYSAPLSPIYESNYEIIKNLFTEVRSIFKDEFLHIGGDEVAKECWEHDPEIVKFMTNNNIKDVKQLESYYISRLLAIVKDTNFRPLVWEEVWSNEYGNNFLYSNMFQQKPATTGSSDSSRKTNSLSKDAIVQVWRSWTYEQVLPNVLNSGFKVVLSAPWYIDLIKYGESTWKRYYQEDLSNKLFGGEACLWGEFVDETNLESRLWPSASAVGERLWSNPKLEPEVSEVVSARLGHFRCYMRKMGYGPRPLFPNPPCLDEPEEVELDFRHFDFGGNDIL